MAERISVDLVNKLFDLVYRVCKVFKSLSKEVEEIKRELKYIQAYIKDVKAKRNHVQYQYVDDQRNAARGIEYVREKHKSINTKSVQHCQYLKRLWYRFKIKIQRVRRNIKSVL